MPNSIETFQSGENTEHFSIERQSQDRKLHREQTTSLPEKLQREPRHYDELEPKKRQSHKLFK